MNLQPLPRSVNFFSPPASSAPKVVVSDLKLVAKPGILCRCFVFIGVWRFRCAVIFRYSSGLVISGLPSGMAPNIRRQVADEIFRASNPVAERWGGTGV
jgi:hypothetical protein